MTVLPQVNINGDNVETLLTQYWAVMKAAQDLRNKMSQAAPHGRNYQTLPDGSLYAARTEWLDLMQMATGIEKHAEHHVTYLMTEAARRMDSVKLQQMTMRVMS